MGRALKLFYFFHRYISDLNANVSPRKIESVFSIRFEVFWILIKYLATLIKYFENKN